MLTFNVAAVGTRHAIELPRIEPGGTPEPMLRRPVTFGVEDGPVETPVYRRDDFGAGAEIAGPAVIGQVDATTLLPPGSSARVDSTSATSSSRSEERTHEHHRYPPAASPPIRSCSRSSATTSSRRAARWASR